MLQKEFVPHQESSEIKELGFDEPCLSYWDDDKVFGLAFVTVLWLCHMRSEDVSRKEIIEIMGMKKIKEV